MTDPIPTPYRFPSMGHGACWSDNLAAIESDHGPVQPYTPPCTSTLHQVAPSLGDAPQTPAETLELADQLDDYGGLDEKDAARFLREAVAARAPVLTELAAAGSPTTHEHIRTTTSPTRCVQCRHYLTPWWRRTLDRARRWAR